MQTWRDIAIIVNKKGLDGGLVLQWHAGPSFVLDAGQELHLVPPRTDAPRCVHLSQDCIVGDPKSAAFFAEVENADVADRILGCHILIDEADLDSDILQAAGEEDPFVGWEIHDGQRGLIGTVAASDERFEQILVEVKVADAADIEGDTKLIPLVDDIIIAIDEDNERLTIACPPGLLDL